MALASCSSGISVQVKGGAEGSHEVEEPSSPLPVEETNADAPMAEPEPELPQSTKVELIVFAADPNTTPDMRYVASPQNECGQVSVDPKTGQISYEGGEDSFECQLTIDRYQGPVLVERLTSSLSLTFVSDTGQSKLTATEPVLTSPKVGIKGVTVNHLDPWIQSGSEMKVNVDFVEEVVPGDNPDFYVQIAGVDHRLEFDEALDPDTLSYRLELSDTLPNATELRWGGFRPTPDNTILGPLGEPLPPQEFMAELSPWTDAVPAPKLDLEAPIWPAESATTMTHVSTSTTPALSWELPLDAGVGLAAQYISIYDETLSTRLGPWVSIADATVYQGEGLSLEDGHHYRVEAYAEDAMGNASTVHILAKFNVDARPPRALDQVSGPGTHASLVASPNFSWNVSDTDNDVVGFEVALGSATGLTDILNWTEVGLATSYQAENLVLQAGEEYVFRIRAVDNAGWTGGVAEKPWTSVASFSYDDLLVFKGEPMASAELPSASPSFTSFSVVDSLPAGLNLDPSTGAISGTAAESFVAESFTMRAHEGDAFHDTEIQIESGLHFTVDVNDADVDQNPGDGICATVSADCSLAAAAMEIAAVKPLFVLIDIESLTISVTTTLNFDGNFHLRGTGTAGTLIRPALNTLAMNIAAGSWAKLSDLQISGGRANDFVAYGLAINSMADYTELDNMWIYDNQSSTHPAGGIQISGEGHLLITNSIFQDNSGHGHFGVGADIRNTGTTIIQKTVFLNNDGTLTLGGGLMYMGTDGDLLVEDCSFLNNDISHGGAGIRTSWAGNVTIRRSFFSNNTSGFSGSHLHFYDTRESINLDSLSLVGGNSSSVVLDNSNDLPVTIRNTTISGGNYGVEVKVVGNTPPQIIHSTIAGQTGYGIYTHQEVVEIGNSVLDTSGDDCRTNMGAAADYIASLGGNVSNDSSCGLSESTDSEDIDPALQALEILGGGQIFPILVDSPAIDHGVAELCPETDQRQKPRPEGARCDAGAFERQLDD